ncbi:MAG: CoA transferase [Chloroflexi bacterium]|nr:CoA transferase [Chloroflexota bacterium]
MAGPLEGIRVIEFSQIIAGPVSGVLLSDLGADVIKVEPPWGDPWRAGGGMRISETESKIFISVNRGKRSISLDLTSDEGRSVVRRLVSDADVVTVNHRADVLPKLGIDYETLRAVKPDIIYTEVTAFGRDGPYANDPGYDLLMQGLTGIMAGEGVVEGYKAGGVTVNDGVPRYLLATPMVDFATGYSVVQSVCAALFYRERTGKGQKVETSLFANALSIQTHSLTEFENAPSPTAEFVNEELPILRDAGLTFSEIDDIYRERKSYPFAGFIYYRSYQTADQVITLGCLSEPLRKKAADCLGIEDIRFNEDYDPTTEESWQFAIDLSHRVEKIISGKPAAEWIRIFHEAGVPAAPVLYVEEMLDHEQSHAVGMIIEQEHPVAGKVRGPGPLSKWSESPPEAVRTSPGKGQHTAEILAESGYSETEIAALLESGAALG